ncbi:lysozyme inhibitor LprI family protein [Acidithiobacillus thiooxidans]|uniref:lysozyme inhibitor LprI family protein n=1 Tax=Acidithiobacillus thiooxidans TaxID=930 RepID=UPI00356494AD
MKRFALMMLALLMFWVPSSYGSSEPVTVAIQELPERQYQMILRQGDKVVVSMQEDEEGGTMGPPEAQTFPTHYCGVPAQVVVLKDEGGPSACGKSPGFSCGINWRFLIYNAKTWALMDDFTQSDLKDSYIGKWTSRADGEYTIAVLRAGHYYGPVCRIFDLYTQSLPSTGPSFDCRTASNRAEETVCKYPKLAKLDHAYGARLRERLLKAPAAERQNIANGYYWDMEIRDDAGTNINELKKAYKKALGTDSAQYFQEKKSASNTGLDCSKAHTASEKLICTNPKLQALDSQLAQAYHQAFVRTGAKSPARQELIQAQRAWVKELNTCNSDNTCLQQAYQRRIQELGGPRLP